MISQADGATRLAAQTLDGVQRIDLTTHGDDRGYLFEIIHATDAFLPRFGQVYVVCSPARGVIRAFHKHYRLWNYFCVVRGAAKFVLAKADDAMVTDCAENERACPAESLATFVLTERRPSLLVVPPYTWHGWMALEDNTVVVATGSEVYDRGHPGEIRVPPGVFGDVWTVNGR
jgi:dTDP-4-dehydrorhamnose 3,5-epimerase-like enzyme